jgi:biotin transport system substrate-specific component
MLGLCGLPIFTGAGSGILYLSGPTGGYLAGFIAASLFLGRFIQRTRRFSACLALFILADLLLLFCGMIWLRLSLGLSFSRTFLIGVLPFLPGDFIKALVAAGLYLNLRTRIQEIL